MTFNHVRSFVGVLVILNALFIAGLVFGEGEWGYDGDHGPDHWDELSDDYALCGTGNSQSPIDITGAAGTTLTAIEFHYETVPMAVFNNGHTIEVEYEAGSSIVYNEKPYDVLQFHFHQPSEHTIDGETFPMEMHIVHKNAASGNLAVVGVMIREGDADNEAYAELFNSLPIEVSQPDGHAGMSINAADLLPSDTSHYVTYEGSLTTPPCSEIVRWLVLAEPVELSATQIDSFGAIYNNNARPVQPLNTRDLFSNGQ